MPDETVRRLFEFIATSASSDVAVAIQNNGTNGSYVRQEGAIIVKGGAVEMEGIGPTPILVGEHGVCK